MTPKAAEKLKLAGALVGLVIAGVGFVRFYRSSNPPAGRAYFYDLSSKALFIAPHSSVPPIKGNVGDEEDGVRAIVISTTGDCNDTKSQKIAYLETYTLELKRQVELRTADKAPDATVLEASEPMIRRGEAHGFILVKRPDEVDWHPMTSPEGEKILQIISTPDASGKLPVVCVP